MKPISRMTDTELVKHLRDALDALYKPDKLKGNPLLTGLFLRAFCKRHPEWQDADPVEALEPALRELLYQDVMPKSEYAKVTDVRAAVAVAITYFRFDSSSELRHTTPRREINAATALLLDPDVFRTIVPAVYWEKWMDTLRLGLKHVNTGQEGKGDSEPNFRKALAAGCRSLAQAIHEHERAALDVSRVEQTREPAQPASKESEPIVAPPESSTTAVVDWQTHFRQRQTHKIEQMSRSDGTIMALDRFCLPRRVATDASEDFETLSVGEALTRQRHSAVLGLPGSGKTTALRHAAMYEQKQDPSKLAVWLSLPEYAAHAPSLSVQEFVFKGEIEPLCETANAGARARSEWSALEHEGRVAFFLDDWDRVPAEAMPAVAHRIGRLSSYRLILQRKDIRLSVDEGGLWRLVPLTDPELCRLVEVLLPSDDHSEAVDHVLGMLDQSAGFREAAQAMPMLIDIACRQAEQGTFAVALAIQEALLGLLRRAASADTTPETTFEAIAFTLQWRYSDVQAWADLSVRRSTLLDVTDIRFKPSAERILAHALHAGVWQLDAPDTMRLPFEAMRDVLVAAGLAHRAAWSLAVGWLPFRPEASLLLNHIAALTAATGVCRQLIRDIAQEHSATGTGWVWAGTALCHAREAGLVDEELKQTILAKVNALAGEDTGIAMRVARARLSASLGNLESADEFATVAMDARQNIWERVIAVRCLSAFPHEPVANTLSELAQQDEPPVRLKRAAIQSLLQMPGQAGIASVVSLTREGSDAIRQAAIEAMLQSDRWQVKLELEALRSSAPIGQLIEQVERTLKPRSASSKGSSATPMRIDSDSIRSAVLNLRNSSEDIRILAIHTLASIGAAPPEPGQRGSTPSPSKRLFDRLQETVIKEGERALLSDPLFDSHEVRGWIAFEQLVRAARSDVSMLARIVATEALAKIEYRRALLNLEPSFLPPIWTLELGTRLDP